MLKVLKVPPLYFLGFSAQLYLSPPDLLVYKAAYTQIESITTRSTARAIILLDAPVATATARIARRARPGEEEIGAGQWLRFTCAQRAWFDQLDSDRQRYGRGYATRIIDAAMEPDAVLCAATAFIEELAAHGTA